MKNFFTKMLLSVVMLTLAADHAAAYRFTAVNEDGDTIYYNTLSDKTCEVTYGHSVTWYEDSLVYCGTINIPEVVVYNDTAYTVTRIGKSAFYHCAQLKKVSIPSTVTAIRGNAFAYCYQLTDIGELPEGLDSIFYDAFCYTPIETFKIPANLSYIHGSALFRCSELKSITVAEENKNFVVRDNVLFSKDLETLVLYPYSLTDEKYTVPATVKKIGVDAFAGNRLKDITMTNVDTISEEAFRASELLEYIELPNTVTYLGSTCFAWCYSLKEIKLSESLKYIGNFAFGSDSLLTSITIPASVEYISYYAFRYCSSLEAINVNSGNEYYSDNGEAVLYTKNEEYLVLYPPAKQDKTYSVASNCKTIGTSSFRYANSLESVILPEGLDSIGRWAFMNCSSIKQLDLPASLSYFADGSVFYKCASLATVTLPESNTNYVVDNNVIFSKDKTTLVAYAPNNSLTSYEIPESVDTILWEAFFWPQNLKKVTIPASVNSIDGYAFSCDSAHMIDTIICKISEPIEISGSVFYSDLYDYVLCDHAILVVPDGAKEKYKAAKTWKIFKNIVEESEVTGINEINADNTPATENDKIYDLQGRRLDMIPENGMYIKGGKKYLSN